MVRFGIVARILLALLIVGLLAGSGAALYRFAWAQGYQVAAVSASAAAQGAGSAPAQVAPYAHNPFAYGPMGYGFGHHFWGMGFGFLPLFCMGFFLLILFGGLFRGMGHHRRWANGPWAGHHPGHWKYEPDPEPTPAEKKAE